MLPSEKYQECESPEYNHDYLPIQMQRNNSYDKHEIEEVQNMLVDRFKIKLRHIATLPNYDAEEEQKHEKPSIKPKRQLKLVTNAKIVEDDMEKSKSFSPQPNTNHTSSIKMHLNFFSFFPMKSMKRTNSLPQNDEYHYCEDFFDVTTKKGSLKHQQDKFTVFINNDKIKPRLELFFGVFDGHRTSTVSEFLSDNLIKYIQNNKYYDTDTERAIKEAFLKLDEELLNYQKKMNLEGGSTALCALIKENELFVINIGDSIAALITDGKIQKINEEHNTNNEKEKILMEKKGALIVKIKNAFRIMGEISVTRSFGDRTYKEYLTCDADVYKYDLRDFEKDGLLFLGSDGFWNLSSLEKTLANHKKWKFENQNKFDGTTEFLMSDIFLNFENVKKDNMTLACIDLAKIYKMLGKYKRKGSEDEILLKKSSTTMIDTTNSLSNSLPEHNKRFSIAITTTTKE